jgi:DNA-nicking Smr family endonuclease
LQTLCRAAWPEEEIDLHGLKKVEAARVLISRMSEAFDKGKNVILIIHGRGSHSEDAVSVLREVTLETLQKSPLAALVSGFATAASRHGGRGALYVFLKKS